MCGRFALYTPASKIAEVFEIVDPPELTPRWNVAPTDPVAVVVVDEGRRQLKSMRWGLVPYWQPTPKSGPPLINARAEQLDSKPAFRKAFRARRCLVPADGFYEWKKEGPKTKIPYLFRRRDGQPLALAGLWENWWDVDQSLLLSTTIVTTSANELVEPLHDRMPVVLPESAWAAWLDPANEDVEALKMLLVPFSADEMERVAVSTRVNSVKNDDPSVLQADPR